MMIDRVVGNNRIVEQVGEGGMGAVYRAVDLMLDREVAIKAIRPELTRDTEIVERFRAEARMLARVNHPAIATIYSFFVDGGDLFLAMEFVRGETLARLLQTGGPMPWERAVSLLATALEGIEQAHQAGIVHRDLKPENLMITEAGAVKVMDFGIARVVGSGRLTRTGLLIGTLRYMAPEQIRGEEADRRTDVYALGTVLYEMLTGAVPFDGASDYAVLKAQVEEQPRPPSASIPALPAWLDRAILRALEKDPARRFQTVEDLRRHLLGRGQPLTTAAVMPLGVGVAAGGAAAGAAAGVSGVGVAAGAAGDVAAGAAGAAGPLGAAGMKRLAGDAPDPDGTVLRPGAPGLAGGPAAAGGRDPDATSDGPVAPPGRPAAPGGAAGAAGVAGAPGGAGAAGGAAAPGGGGSYREMPPWRPAAPGQGKGRSKALLAATLALIAIVALAVAYRLRVPAPGGAGGAAAGSVAGSPAAGGPATAGAAGAAGNRGGAVPGDRAVDAGPAGTVGNTVAGQPAAGAERTAAGGTSPGGQSASGAMAGAAPGGAGAGGDQAGRAGTGSGSTVGASGARDAPAAESEGAPGGGAESPAQGTAGQAGEKVGEAVAADLRHLGAALVAESGEIRGLYAQSLSRQERRSGHEIAAGEQLGSALQDFRSAAERFDSQFEGGFFTRGRLRLGRLTHGEDERAQMQRLARALVESGAHVEALMLQARPTTGVRLLWRRIHSQVQRLAQECGI